MSCPQDRSVNIAVASSFIGIRGIVPSNPEVIGVFPSMSSTIIPHMQQIKFHRGDSFDIKVQVQDDVDPPMVVSIDGAVLRFAAKVGYGTPPSGSFVGNEGAAIIKRSYDASEIEISNASKGQAIIHIQRGDTIELPLVPMVWDMEVTFKGPPIAVTGKVITIPGDMVVPGIATGFEGVVPGDILTVEGRDVMVVQNLNSALVTDFSGWTGGFVLPYEMHRGLTRTIASGSWTCVGDVVI
jgi:hypothetical protein